MIPRDYITEWRREAPWVQDAQVEQDLVLTRALVEIFRVEAISDRLAFRGGTALYKLHLRPAARYSEDIDLVQVIPEPIGGTISALRSVLDPWLGRPRRHLHEGRIVLTYRFESEDQPPLPLRLKLETNSREQFTELGYVTTPLAVTSRWFAGSAVVTTFVLEELLGTKLRALYQRRKGRDLFDLWHALNTLDPDPDRIVRCFLRYMEEGGHAATRANFERNLLEKLGDPTFVADLRPLLRPGIDWNVDEAARVVRARLVARLPGRPWKGLQAGD